MKKFTIEVSHASPGQLQTIAAELKIMGNGWEKFGPRITINKRALEAPQLRIPGSSRQNKQAPLLNDIKKSEKKILVTGLFYTTQGPAIKIIS